jgi:membrane protein YqaA with SNARE-associated domain
LSWVEEYGYLGLFLFAFLAATIVPIGSESAVVGALVLKMSRNRVLLWASMGNCLGVAFNYVLGYWAAERWLKRRNMNNSVQKAHAFVGRYGWIALLASWLPFIGDPITIAAGVLRMDWCLVFTIAFSLRILRYVFVIWVFSYGV